MPVIGVSSLPLALPSCATGGSFRAVIVRIVLCTSLLTSPSNSVQESVRVGISPPALGSSLVELNATACMNV